MPHPQSSHGEAGPYAIAHAGTTHRHSRRINSGRNSEKGKIGLKFLVICPTCGRNVFTNPIATVFSHTCGEQFRFVKGHK